MYSFTLQLFTAAFLATATIVWSLPVHRRQLSTSLPTAPASTPATFKVSKETIDQLKNIKEESNGLLTLWKRARSLTNESWLTAEVRNVILMDAHAYIFMCIIFSTNDWNLKYAEVAFSTSRLQPKRAKAKAIPLLVQHI